MRMLLLPVVLKKLKRIFCHLILSSREFELDAFGMLPLDTKVKQVNGQIQEC